MKIAHRIKEAMKDNGITQAELSRVSGISKSTLSEWLNGKYEPKQNNIYILSKALSVNPTWLMGLDVQKEIQEDITIIYEQLEPPRQQKVYNFAEHQLKEQEDAKVDVYGLSAAGEAIEYNDQFEIQEEKVSYIPKGTDGALVVRGKSMEPTLKDGELLFFEQTPQVENGEIAVVEIKGEAVTTKRVRYDFENEEIILQSINPDYDDMRFKNKDVRIIGKVLL